MLAVRRISAAAGLKNDDVNIHPNKPVGWFYLDCRWSASPQVLIPAQFSSVHDQSSGFFTASNTNYLKGENKVFP